MLGLVAVLMAAPASAAPAWSVVTNKVPGIFDIGGPRADGWPVVPGTGKLFLVDPPGAVPPYPPGFPRGVLYEP